MKLSYKWLVAIVLILGAFMSFLDQTIVNIAIPRLQSVFAADLHSVQWVVSAYILTQGALAPTMPFLVQMLGSKRTFILALAAFTLGSALCGLAWSLPILILFRVFQALGAAILWPLIMTILFREFPLEERGVAMAAIGVPMLLGPALGPIVGGYLVTFATWQIIFFINVPIGILAIILALVLLHETHVPTTIRFDLPGFVCSAAGLTAVLYASSEASTAGWSSPIVLIPLSGGLLLLLAFIIIELAIARRGGTPLLDLRLLANRSYTAGSIAGICIFPCLFGIAFLVPIYLQALRGLSAFQTSMVLIPQVLAAMLGMTLGGKLVDRLGDARPIVAPGLVLTVASLWLLATSTLTTPYWLYALILMLLAFGLNLVMQPIGVAAMADLRETSSIANGSTLSTVIRSIGGSLGLALLSTLVQTQTQAHLQDQKQADLSAALLYKQASLMAMHDAFFLLAISSILALLAAMFLHKRRPSSSKKDDAVPAHHAQ
ncbi:DHA2 family efflux MFS transporter permease subunit [Ktedonosporobacter rubrisoli]|uniref:DHA2 family efflux MFS transporter permease subunit n=1 Tax=Ktedonosporobacter rubrisoli TaxID=2509675 RepID=A0A4P6JQ39_KTERU|nr:MDR family MFS transporter [Ktedonosporobacter rubrisoli]QBD77425.1 DHA2 family efflux MFS transporter permease subunit [Ktedonosporobacter rubrisoli]